MVAGCINLELLAVNLIKVVLVDAEIDLIFLLVGWGSISGLSFVKWDDDAEEFWFVLEVKGGAPTGIKD